MVREERLELSRVTPLEPKSSASTNSATLACKRLFECYLTERVAQYSLANQQGAKFATTANCRQLIRAEQTQYPFNSSQELTVNYQKNLMPPTLAFYLPNNLET